MRGISRGARLALAVALTVAAPARATPGWVAPATTLSAAGTPASAPDIALTPGGETIAAWVRSGVVEVSVRPPGGSFGAPQVVSFEGADPAAAPEIAIAPDGRALLAWRDRCDAARGTCVAEALLRSPGGAFGAPVALSATGAGAPKGVFTADGRAIVAWERASSIEAAVAAPGGGFSGKGATIDTNDIEVSSPDLATDAVGRAYLVWAAGAGSSALRLAISPAGAADFPVAGRSELASETSQTDPGSGATDSVSYAGPAIAVDGAGNGAILWLRVVVHYEPGLQPMIATTIQSVSRAAGGALGPVQDLDTGFSTAGYSRFLSTNPRVAVDSLGNAIGAWTARTSNTSTTEVRRAVRPAGSTRFGVASSVVTGTGDDAPAAGSAWVAAVGSGGIVLSFLQSTLVRAAVAQAGGPFTTPVAISAAGAGLSAPHVAGGSSGDAVAAWSILDGSTYRAQMTAYDATPPELRQVQAPAAARAGEPVTFSVSPFDTWSAVTSSWSFGDGTPDAAGTAVSHAFARAGSYTVTLTGWDGIGNASTATRPITIAKPDRTAPLITQLRLTRARFAIAPRATAVTARTPRGTTIRFKLSERATVRLYIKRVLAGHRKGRTCSTHASAGRRCSVYRAAGKLVRTIRRGRRKVAFSGRIGQRPLRPGHYRLTVIAKDAAGNTSKPRRARFTVVPR